MGGEVDEIMNISGWARTSIAKTKHVEADLASVGRVVSDSGGNAGISLIGKDDAGRMIYIHLSPRRSGARDCVLATGGQVSRLDRLVAAAHLLGWVIVYTPPAQGAPLGAGINAQPDPRGVK